MLKNCLPRMLISQWNLSQITFLKKVKKKKKEIKLECVWQCLITIILYIFICNGELLVVDLLGRDALGGQRKVDTMWHRHSNQRRSGGRRSKKTRLEHTFWAFFLIVLLILSIFPSITNFPLKCSKRMPAFLSEANGRANMSTYVHPCRMSKYVYC